MDIRVDMILTDDYAFDAGSNYQKSDWSTADIKNFDDYDFKYKSGRATWNDDGTTIAWTMLTNYYYTLRLKNQ